MNCDKKTFETLKKAVKRANQINHENNQNKNNNLKLRAYKCNDCNKFHLSSLSEHQHKYFTDKNYKTKVREKSFLKLETEYWQKKLKIN